MVLLGKRYFDVGFHPHAPYAISHGSILPKREEIQNLLVPVCVAAQKPILKNRNL